MGSTIPVRISGRVGLAPLMDVVRESQALVGVCAAEVLNLLVHVFILTLEIFVIAIEGNKNHNFYPDNNKIGIEAEHHQ